MHRRDFIAAIAAAAADLLATRAQPAERVRLVGVLFAGQSGSVPDGFREELAKLGWVEGRNLRIDYRVSAGDPVRLDANAEELVNLRPDVIFAVTGPAARALQQHTQIIPIVFLGGGDAVDNNIVNSVARPVGNTTGFANLVTSQGSKWLELLKEAVPHITRVADIFNGETARPDAPLRAVIDAAAPKLGITIVRMPLRDPVDAERAISAFAAEPNGGLLLTGGGLFRGSEEALDRLALQYRLPLMSGGAAAVREGVLMSQGPTVPELLRGATSYVDRILRGAKPSDLPIQYPTRFQLVVNLKTAKAIGLTISESFLLRADEVVE
jgi:putative ABC transport system substrate-binding protein